MFGFRYSVAISFVVSVALTAHSLNAAEGDTVVVKTLQFKDITKRSGTWLFPPPDRYEKVLMQYTLKCDPATTQDRFNCGEWDYLTYTVLRDSTGEFDSTRLSQVNFRVRGTTPDSFSYRSTFVNRATRFRTFTVQRSGSPGDFFTVGTGGQNSTSIIRPEGGRARYVWTSVELRTAGLAAGTISGIRLTTSAAAPNTSMFTLRMQQKVGATVPKTLGNSEFTTVVRRNISFVSGVNHVPFSTPFAWDGTSDIVIDISCASAPSIVGLEAGSATAGVIDDGTRRAYAFTAGDEMILPSEVGAAISNEITIQFWCWGDAAKMPRAHNTLEAFDARGRRVLNVHAPWDNGTIYWDAGITPADGSVDRIEKGALDNMFEGQWNHWAFVKTKAGIMRIYHNGTLFHEGNGKSRLMNGIERFVIGSGGAASYEGLLDDIQIWNVALDETTIRNWMSRRISDSHPQYAQLIAYYRGEIDSDPSVARDESAGGFNARLLGVPTRERLRLDQLGHLTGASTARPLFSFETGAVTQTTTRLDVDVVEEPHRTSVIRFNRPVEPRIYVDGAPDHPAVATDTLLVQKSGWLFTYDENGFKVDSVSVATENTLRKVVRPYFNPIVDFEIGRFITPYGIGLDLGPKGFRWEYDVTDFAPLLRNNVTLSAGNQQELIDLTFVFIKGTPARDVKQIDQVYYDRNAQYPAVLAGTSLPPVNIPLNPDARTFRLKAVTSGHDFSNPTNCAEFCPREHFLSIDGTERFKWTLWSECGNNPVFPQGGTWPIDRTGWCPGAPVDIYDFEATSFATGKTSLTIDYGVKKQAPEENWGRWEVSTQLIGYSAPNFAKDGAIADILAPNSWEYYGRTNPICGTPIVVLQNNGSETITECSIEYGIVGGDQKTFAWKGTLGFLGKDTVVLPQPAWPTQGGLHTFSVKVVRTGDEYASNDRRTASFVMPPVYYNDLQVVLRTNKQASEQYEWKLRRTSGEIIGQGKDLASETTFTYDFDLADGCYDFELINREGLGLDFWFVRAQLGSGSLTFFSGGTAIKTFQPDFGNKAWSQFSVGPKPTITTNVDSLLFQLALPGKIEQQCIVRSLTSAPLRIDSVTAFSARKHFNVVTASMALPALLHPGDSMVVIVAFERADAGTTSGTLRIFSNDERTPTRQVRLIGTVGVTGVDDAVDPNSVVALQVLPHPVTEGAIVKLHVFDASLLDDARIVIRNVIGQTVATLFQGSIVVDQSEYSIPSTLAAGFYVISIESPSVKQSVPLVINR